MYVNQQPIACAAGRQLRLRMHVPGKEPDLDYAVPCPGEPVRAVLLRNDDGEMTTIYLCRRHGAELVRLGLIS